MNHKIILTIIGCVFLAIVVYIAFNYGVPDSHIEDKPFSYKLKEFGQTFWLSIPITIFMIFYAPFYLIKETVYKSTIDSDDQCIHK